MLNEMWMFLHRLFDACEFGKFRGDDEDVLYKSNEFFVLIEEPLPDDAHQDYIRMVYGLFRGFENVEKFVEHEKFNVRYRGVTRVAKHVWVATAYYQEVPNGPQKTVSVRLRAGRMTIIEHPLQEQDPSHPDSQTLKVFQFQGRKPV